MVPPRVEIRRYTANRADATYTNEPISHAHVFTHPRESFPSLDAMTLLELEADRDDH